MKQAIPQVGYARALFYSASVCVRILAVIVVTALMAAPIALGVSVVDGSAGGRGALIFLGLALLGCGLPLVAGILSRADWVGAVRLLGFEETTRPEFRLLEPSTLVRPLAYTVVMLTLGGAVAGFSTLIVVGSCVAVVSPLIIALGDEAVIGPFTITTIPHAVTSAVIAVVLLTALVVIAPLAAKTHASVSLQMLIRPEQGLQRALTTTELSRARLVRAFDVERRRIERDLHDGVQPELMSVSMTLGLALSEMGAEDPGRDDVLRAQRQAQKTLDTLRKFVRNIHPQVLVDHGLAAALGEVADGLIIPISIKDTLPRRLSPELETNLFFCVSELLSNVVKHSGASHAVVELEMNGDNAEISVRDDGRGGASPHTQGPGGLDGIADRLAAFDGALDIDSPVGGPTTISITVHDLGRSPEDA